MAGVKRNIGKLPAAPKAVQVPPDSQPRFMDKLAQAWLDAYEAAGNMSREMAAEGVRWRASWAAGCARNVAYKIAHADAERHLAKAQLIEYNDTGVAFWEAEVQRTAPTDPPDIASIWRMALGTLVHDLLELTAKEVFPGCETEVKVDLRPDVDGAATSDIIVREPDGKVIVVEIKTQGGFAYKMAASTFKGGPQGPKHAHKVQAACLAHQLDADEMVIGYLAMEPVSPSLAKGLGVGSRFTAEWTFGRDTIVQLAEREHRRVSRIIKVVDTKGAAAVPRAIEDPAEIPVEARITDARTGMWTVERDGQILQSGRYWQCDGYCDYRDRCISDGP